MSAMTVIPLESLPLGFRFRPTDEELVNHYLKGKIAGRRVTDLCVIPEVDVCKCEPWDLPGKSLIKSDDLEWFFFAPRDCKYPNGRRSSRSTNAGYWKATGKERMIRSRNPATAENKKPAIIGTKRTLVFHQGRAPKGKRTGWIMHEYRTTEPGFESGHWGSYVLYRLFNRQEEETPGSNTEEMEERCNSPSLLTASPSNLQNDTGAGQGAVTALNNANLTSILLQQPLTKPNSTVNQHGDVMMCVTDDDTDCSMACLSATAKNRASRAPHVHLEQTGEQTNWLISSTTQDDHSEQTEQDDALLDVLARLPDLQPEQSHGRFPSISSPMHPYADHPFFGSINEPDDRPFFGSINEPDVMGYLDSDVAPQDWDQLLNSVFVKADRRSAGNDQSDCTAVVMSPPNFGNGTLPKNSWATTDLDHEEPFVQGLDDMGASDLSLHKPQLELQMNMGHGNLGRGAQMSLGCKGETQEIPLYELAAYETEQATTEVHGSSILESSGLDCSIGSAAHYPPYLHEWMEESSSNVDTTDPLEGAGGWAMAPSVQQFVDLRSINKKQGTAARRIRLMCSLRRAPRNQNIGTFQLQNEGQKESSSGTSILSATCEEGYLNAASKSKAEDHMYIEGGEDMPAEVLRCCAVEAASLTEKLHDLSVDENTSLRAQLPREAELTCRLKKKSVEISENMPESPAPEIRTRKTTAVAREIWLVLSLMIPFVLLVAAWKASSYWL